MLDDYNFRNLVKQEAQKKFDGDYDILATDLQNLKTQNNALTNGEKIANTFESRGVSDGLHLLNCINTAVPNLQISVPVNCDEWNVSSFIPKVVPVPIDFDDNSNHTIIGYDSNGNTYTFNLDEDPDVPVVVISVSERIDENGNNKWCDSSYICGIFDAKGIPDVPTSLNLHHGSKKEFILEWSDVTDETGYKIYRKDGSGNFKLRATTLANHNGYVDKYLTPGTRYWYKVCAYNNNGNSAFSQLKTSIASGRDDGEQLSINALMFETKQDLNKVESWIRGVPELRLRIIRGFANSQNAEYVYRSSIISPPNRKSIIGDWWNHNIPITRWYTDALGTILVFDWEEEDNSMLNKLTLTAKYENKSTGTFDFGGTMEFNVSKNGPIGFTSVYYWNNNKEISINGFKWRLN